MCEILILFNGEVEGVRLSEGMCDCEAEGKGF